MPKWRNTYYSQRIIAIIRTCCSTCGAADDVCNETGTNPWEDQNNVKFSFCLDYVANITILFQSSKQNRRKRCMCTLIFYI